MGLASGTQFGKSCRNSLDRTLGNLDYMGCALPASPEPTDPSESHQLRNPVGRTPHPCNAIRLWHPKCNPESLLPRTALGCSYACRTDSTRDGPRHLDIRPEGHARSQRCPRRSNDRHSLQGGFQARPLICYLLDGG